MAHRENDELFPVYVLFAPYILYTYTVHTQINIHRQMMYSIFPLYMAHIYTYKCTSHTSYITIRKMAKFNLHHTLPSMTQQSTQNIKCLTFCISLLLAFIAFCLYSSVCSWHLMHYSELRCNRAHSCDARHIDSVRGVNPTHWMITPKPNPKDSKSQICIAQYEIYNDTHEI